MDGVGRNISLYCLRHYLYGASAFSRWVEGARCKIKEIDKIKERNTKFEFTIQKDSNGYNMKYKFHVTISKVEKTKGFWSKKDASRYITNIKITENNSWSNSEKESYFIDNLDCVKGFFDLWIANSKPS